jgi:tryptophan-rich sensory protein
MTWFSAESRAAGLLLVPSLAWIGVVTAFTSAAAFGP